MQWRQSRGGEVAIPHKKYRARVSIRPLKVLAVFWALLCPECVSDRGFAPDPAGEAYSASQIEPHSWWVGAQYPLPNNPTFAVGHKPRLSALRDSETHVSESISVAFSYIFDPKNKFGSTHLRKCTA